MPRIIRSIGLAAAGGALALGLTAAQAQQTPTKMTLFGQPSVNNDSIWMALEKGFYKDEGLDVTYRLFPSGTTVFLPRQGRLPHHRGDRARQQRLRRRRRQGHQDPAGPCR